MRVPTKIPFLSVQPFKLVTFQEVYLVSGCLLVLGKNGTTSYYSDEQKAGSSSQLHINIG